MNQGSIHGALITLPLSPHCFLTPAHSTSRSKAHWPLIGVLMSALLIIHIHLFLSCAIFYSHSPSIHQESLLPWANTSCAWTHTHTQTWTLHPIIDSRQKDPSTVLIGGDPPLLHPRFYSLSPVCRFTPARPHEAGSQSPTTSTHNSVCPFTPLLLFFSLCASMCACQLVKVCVKMLNVCFYSTQATVCWMLRFMDQCENLAVWISFLYLERVFAFHLLCLSKLH